MDKKHTIALAMILKDSENPAIVQRNLDSVGKNVDAVYYTITHTTVKTSKKAKELARDMKVYALSKGYPEPEVSYFKWVKDFSAARNFNWSRVPEKWDYILWLDADDVLRGADALQEVAEIAAQNSAEAMFFNYLYQVEMGEDGKIKHVLIEHLRERLIKNSGAYKWVGPIHETLIEQRGTNKMDSEKCDVVHLSDDSRRDAAMKRNIDILEEELRRQGTQQDPRIIYYLGKAYFDLHEEEYYEKAEDMITRYLQGSETNVRSGWEEERAQAWDYLGEIYRIKGLFNKSVQATANALIESPKFPQTYINMALSYVYLQRWDKARFWADLSQKVAYPKTTLVMNPRDMKARLLEVYFNIAVAKDNVKLAYDSMEGLLQIFPDADTVKQRFASAQKAMLDNETVHRIINIAKFLNDTKQQDKITSLLEAVPDELQEVPVIGSLRRDFVPPRKWNDNEIAIVCGRGFEKWSPDNLKKGIGGSEEAVIHISKELTNLGWEVTVYGDPEKPQDYDGVHYRGYYEFNPRDEFNVLIGWRNVGFYNNEWSAKKKYLWLHDVQNPMEYTKERVGNVDKIFVLSEAHKATLINDWNKEWLTDDKFLLTGNGIDVKEIESIEKEMKEAGEFKDGKRIIWTSSYDRGLEHLLNMWPDVIKAVPNAKLDIFYGWNLFDKVNYNNPERQAWKAKVGKLMGQKGITHHGRVGQDEILRNTFRAGLWAYPTHFYEISCITAMKCQALGAIPVVTDYAALKETVQHGVRIDVSDSDIYDPEIVREYKNQLIKMLRTGKMALDDVRGPMMEWARNKFSWANVAEQWSKEFK